MTNTRGLEGVVATSSSISSIIDDVLTYRGYNIDDLTENCSFEEVIYLLWNGKLPNQTELDELKKQLADHTEVPQPVFEQMKAYRTENVHPMAALRTAVSMLALYDDEADEMNEEANYRKAIRLQAQMPGIVTGFARIRNGEEPVSPKKDLSFAANFLYMMNGEEPDDISEEAFNKALILHADHELNASTFTARVCVATLSDVYSGVTAAIGRLRRSCDFAASQQQSQLLWRV